MIVLSAPSPVARERTLLWLLAAVQFTHVVDFMMLMPLGPLLMQRLDMSATRFGALVSAYTLASAAMGVLGVFWLDRLERKRTLLMLYAGFITATLLCGAATGAVGLLVARTVAGACAGLMGAVVIAIVSDVVPAERRGQAIGTVMTAYALSAVAGVPLGLGLANLWGWRSPFIVLAAVAGLVWLLLLRFLPRVDGHLSRESGAAEASSPASVFTPRLALGWVLTFTVVFASFLLIPYLGAFMVGNLGLSLSELPWVYLAGGAATLLSSRWIGGLADRLGPARVLAGLLVFTMVPHLLFTHLPPSPLPVVALVFGVFMTLTSGRAIPTMALVASRVPPSLRGRYLAVNMAASDGASGLAAWMGGLLLSTASDGALIGFGPLGFFAVGISALALGLLWVFAGRAVPVNATPAS
ncbi:MFS transporter [Corallococcus praedator]|uniref:MFS transporter n=1 Tax=Corallococcus praedator TaxID=2316724 RepID=A0ABX9Q804_9BACT|nr:MULTISPECIES: myxochelin export MFS transporter MxcK [Corallococcus]RKH16165.1 MFS transporter [Corallococcus sp. CA047B]RKH34984.1 MFS transporter [Corallococcus sp. CA031C]RKH93254.1 MFS transporter [Corallococcus praedator]